MKQADPTLGRLTFELFCFLGVSIETPVVQHQLRLALLRSDFSCLSLIIEKHPEQASLDFNFLLKFFKENYFFFNVSHFKKKLKELGQQLFWLINLFDNLPYDHFLALFTFHALAEDQNLKDMFKALNVMKETPTIAIYELIIEKSNQLLGSEDAPIILVNSLYNPTLSPEIFLNHYWKFFVKKVNFVGLISTLFAYQILLKNITMEDYLGRVLEKKIFLRNLISNNFNFARREDITAKINFKRREVVNFFNELLDKPELEK
jgi:hypothetical protein